RLLVVLYSINVFLTFTLTLFGLCRHWWEQRLYTLDWKRRFLLSVFGLALTTFILVVTLVEKFVHGAWATLLITGTVIAGCLSVRRHYDRVARRLKRADELYSLRLSWNADARSPPLDPKAPTAILLIGANRGAGMYMLQWVRRMFPDRFRNVVFVSVGEVDKQAFDGQGAIRTLQARLDNSLHYFTSYCVSQGLAASARQATGADPLEELSRLTVEVLREFPNSVCFAAKLVFDEDNVLTRWLHNEMPMQMQQKVHLAGGEMVIVPVRVPDEAPRAERVSRSR
ncbi:MAG TPA: amino acid transporter, partial [Solimonas sp.]|nr:amino acid transporter [Solimonas sp.]